MSQRSAERLEAYEERFDGPMSLVALVLVTMFLVRITDTASSDAMALFTVVGAFLWAALVVDLLIRISLAPNRWRYIASEPLYVIAVFFPPLRFFMIGRVLRFLGRRARNRMRDRVTAYVLVVTIEVIVVAAILETAVERDAPGASIVTLGDGLWWAIVTVATVGYGDVVPVTPAGRVIGVGVITVAVVLLSVITANISSRFVAAQAANDDAQSDDDLTDRLQRIEDLLTAAANDVAAAESTERSVKGGPRAATES